MICDSAHATRWRSWSGAYSAFMKNCFCNWKMR